MTCIRIEERTWVEYEKGQTIFVRCREKVRLWEVSATIHQGKVEILAIRGSRDDRAFSDDKITGNTRKEPVMGLESCARFYFHPTPNNPDNPELTPICVQIEFVSDFWASSKSSMWAQSKEEVETEFFIFHWPDPWLEKMQHWKQPLQQQEIAQNCHCNNKRQWHSKQQWEQQQQAQQNSVWWNWKWQWKRLEKHWWEQWRRARHQKPKKWEWAKQHGAQALMSWKWQWFCMRQWASRAATLELQKDSDMGVRGQWNEICEQRRQLALGTLPTITNTKRATVLNGLREPHIWNCRDDGGRSVVGTLGVGDSRTDRPKVIAHVFLLVVG